MFPHDVKRHVVQGRRPIYAFRRNGRKSYDGLLVALRQKQLSVHGL